MGNTSTLIIVTGLPCTGKSYLAQRLQAHFHLPLINKDGIKERLFDSPVGKDPAADDFTRSWSKKLGAASYEILFWCVDILLQAGISVIVESNFSDQWHSPIFQTLQEKYGCRILQIQCVADGHVLTRRFRQRWESGERHPGHVDPDTFTELEAVLLQGRSEPLTVIGPYLEVDATNISTIDLEQVIQWVESFMEE